MRSRRMHFSVYLKPNYLRRRRYFIAMGAMLLIPSQLRGAVGDVVGQPITPQAPTTENFFSVGLAFVGNNADIDRNGLYVNRNGDSTIYIISPLDGSLNQNMPSFDTMIPEWPAAMAYDANRNGLWIGTQRNIGGPGFGVCGDPAVVNADMPIYFWDFDDDSVTLMFTIPFDLINPATARGFFKKCRLDGLAYDDMNSPNTLGDDRLWISDTQNESIGVFGVDGTPIDGFDSTTVNSSLFTCTGLAIGSDKVYLSNNGLGDVFYTNKTPLAIGGQLSQGTQLTDGSRWVADMACDSVTFSPIHVMWVRTNPRRVVTNDIITAYEIEPGGCGAGPQLGACCDSNNPPCRDVPQSNCQGTWTAGVLCADLNPPCFETHRIVLLDRTGSMENAVLADGRTRCLAAWETANSEIVTFFATHPMGSSVAVWTFAGTSATSLTIGFVDEVSALAALAPLENTPCAAATPLAEVVCTSVDALVAAFPTSPMQTLEVSISSDGDENNSSGPCLGPDSVGGMMCGGFDSGSWQQLVCDHAIGKAVMLVKLWGDTNPPLSQSSPGMDTETGLLRSAGISDTVFFQALADATGGTFAFIEDNPPGPSGSPAFGVTGACCLPDTTCQESITEAECAVLGGTHQGDASICADAAGACCLPDDTCQDAITLTACTGQGGSFQGTCTTCANDVIGACCLPDSSCQDGLTPTQCAAQSGTHQGGCSVCTGAPGECDIAVPTVSEWGLVLMTLLVVTAGTTILRSRGSIRTVREGMIQ